MKTFTKTIATLALTGLISQAASAALWELTYTGTVTSVDADIDSFFSVGDTVTGVLVFDDTATDNDGAINAGNYVGESFVLTVDRQLGADYVSSAAAGFAFIGLVDGVGSNDQLSAGGGLMAGPDVNGIPANSAGVFLQDSTGNALSSPGLPPTANLSEWDTATFSFDFEGDVEADVRGDVTGLSLVQVPEPTSLALLGLGGLLVARRRR